LFWDRDKFHESFAADVPTDPPAFMADSQATRTEKDSSALGFTLGSIRQIGIMRRRNSRQIVALVTCRGRACKSLLDLLDKGWLKASSVSIPKKVYVDSPDRAAVDLAYLVSSLVEEDQVRTVPLVPDGVNL
jgi:hypothetical protein